VGPYLLLSTAPEGRTLTLLFHSQKTAYLPPYLPKMGNLFPVLKQFPLFCATFNEARFLL
jgi:hypothetical protein